MCFASLHTLLVIADRPNSTAESDYDLYYTMVTYQANAGWPLPPIR